MATTPAAMATIVPMNTRTRMIPISKKLLGNSELRLLLPEQREDVPPTSLIPG